VSDSDSEDEEDEEEEEEEEEDEDEDDEDEDEEDEDDCRRRLFFFVVDEVDIFFFSSAEDLFCFPGSAFSLVDVFGVFKLTNLDMVLIRGGLGDLSQTLTENFISIRSRARLSALSSLWENPL